MEGIKAYILPTLTCLSLIMAIWMIHDLWKLKKKAAVRNFLLMIALGNVINGTASLLPVGRYICSIGQFGYFFGANLSIICSAFLSIFSYKSLAEYDREYLENFTKRNLIKSTLVALAINIAPFFPFFMFSYGAYGKGVLIFSYGAQGDAETCGYYSNPLLDKEVVIWSFVAFHLAAYLPFIIITLSNYLKLIMLLKEQFAMALEQSDTVQFGKLFWYPISQFVSYVPFVFASLTPLMDDYPNLAKFFVWLCSYAAALAGFMTTLVYICLSRSSLQEKYIRQSSADIAKISMLGGKINDYHSGDHYTHSGDLDQALNESAL